jgi:hypothetical protein
VGLKDRKEKWDLLGLKDLLGQLVLEVRKVHKDLLVLPVRKDLLGLKVLLVHKDLLEARQMQQLSRTFSRGLLRLNKQRRLVVGAVSEILFIRVILYMLRIALLRAVPHNTIMMKASVSSSVVQPVALLRFTKKMTVYRPVLF